LAARPNHSSSQSDVAFAAVIIVMAGAAIHLWLAAWLIAWVRGAAKPRLALTSVARVIDDPLRPSKAFGDSVASPWLYWGTVFFLVCGVAMVVLISHRFLRARFYPTKSEQAAYGLASTRDVNSTASNRSVLRRARTVRPGLEKPQPADVGYAVGQSRRRPVWVSVEDSVVILGPPRSGKGLHLVIPMILDSPGAVLTTSTRPDNLAATLRARRERGPVGVFEPQKLVPGVPSVFRWSPIRGCESPQIAMIRSRALAAGTTNGLEGGDFWQAQTESVLRGFLHAAALDGRGASDLYRWSLSASAATEAVRILSGNDRAADGWADALGACIAADPRTRDSIWVGVRTALACLADPRVLDAVSPAPGEQLDPAEFLSQNGSLYLLGTSAGAGAAANLIAAFVEDIVETARAIAAQNTAARLDPPLALILDEVANYPLPSLPSLMSEGGGTGITTVAVLQSLAQARAKWGEHEGAAIWDSAIVKVVLGGGSNARDLADLSALIGERDEDTVSESRDRHGNRTYSTSVRRIPIMDTGRLRTMPFGTGILLLRSARPISLDLRPWTGRRDADALRSGRADLERMIRESRRTAIEPAPEA